MIREFTIVIQFKAAKEWHLPRDEEIESEINDMLAGLENVVEAESKLIRIDSEEQWNGGDYAFLLKDVINTEVGMMAEEWLITAKTVGLKTV